LADIALRGVEKSFGRTRIIHGVDLEIPDGEFAVFVGPSGCGKSTLLRLVAGLEDVSAGDIFIGGERVTDLPPAKRGIAMVFQSYALYPHMSVYQNMAFGLSLTQASRAEIDGRVREAARMLRIDDLLDRKPQALSGGQRQRVAIGRAIVRDPKVFLFDEPLSNLDAALRVQTRVEIAKLHAGTRSTMIYVTHDQVEAMTLADRIVVLNAGRIEQVGAPLELYHQPANLFVAGFIGSPQMNFLAAKVAASDAGGVRIDVGEGSVVVTPAHAHGLQVGEAVTLGIRPDQVRVTEPGRGQARGRIDLVEELGDNHLVHVETPSGERLMARAPGTSACRLGETVGLELPPDDCHVFAGSGGAVPLRRRERAAQPA
jgi:multiple sugar transport system ATP-binding protein